MEDKLEEKLHPVITVRLFGKEKSFGRGIAILLEKIQELHSLRSAAMSIGMAYSKAWTIIKLSETHLGIKLLNSKAGGKNGGGAELTPEGAELLAAYEGYCKVLDEQANTLFKEHFKKFL